MPSSQAPEVILIFSMNVLLFLCSEWTFRGEYMHKIEIHFLLTV